MAGCASQNEARGSSRLASTERLCGRSGSGSSRGQAESGGCVTLEGSSRLCRSAGGGQLKKSQKQTVQPSKVMFKHGKLLNMPAVYSGPPRGDCCGAPSRKPSTEVAALRKEVHELKDRLHGGSPEPKSSLGHCAASAASRGAAPAVASAAARACHVCGAHDHLKASCPRVGETNILTEWIAVLQSETCLLPA